MDHGIAQLRQLDDRAGQFGRQLTCDASNAFRHVLALIRHDAEAAARFAGTCSFNQRIQREELGFTVDFGNTGNLVVGDAANMV